MKYALLLAVTCLVGCANPDDRELRPGVDMGMARNAERQCVMTAPALHVAPLFGGLGGLVAGDEVQSCMRAQGYWE